MIALLNVLLNKYDYILLVYMCFCVSTSCFHVICNCVISWSVSFAF